MGIWHLHLRLLPRVRAVIEAMKRQAGQLYPQPTHRILMMMGRRLAADGPLGSWPVMLPSVRLLTSTSR